jgi:hypothetical protein
MMQTVVTMHSLSIEPEMQVARAEIKTTMVVEETITTVGQTLLHQGQIKTTLHHATTHPGLLHVSLTVGVHLPEVDHGVVAVHPHQEVLMVEAAVEAVEAVEVLPEEAAVKDQRNLYTHELKAKRNLSRLCPAKF